LVGAGYGGSLATWFRVKYPQYARASWASSGPLLADNDFSDVDRTVGRVIESLSSGCVRKERQVLGQAEAIVDSGDEAKINALLQQFHLTGIAPRSFAKIISDMFEFLALNESLHASLRNWCLNPDGSLSGLSELFSVTMAALAISPPTSLDPYHYPSDRLNALYLQCNELGWFRTSANQSKPPSLDLAYYRQLCSDLFEIQIPPDRATFNFEYGGQFPMTNSVVFVNGEFDAAHLKAANSISLAGFANESFVLSIPGEALGSAELGRRSSEPLDDIRRRIAEIVGRWVAFNCSDCNKGNGQCFLHRCVCREDWGGARCDEALVDWRRHIAIEIFATVMPTAILLIVACIGWRVLVPPAQQRSEASASSGKGPRRWSGDVVRKSTSI
jgi:hypothetical protein